MTRRLMPTVLVIGLTLARLQKATGAARLEREVARLLALPPILPLRDPV